MIEQYPSFKAAVFGMVFDQEGRVLLHQRAGTNFLPGYWDFPSGHVENESFSQALIREVKEETDLTVDPKDIELSYLGTNFLDIAYINAIYRVLKWDGQPKIMEERKCSDMRFFNSDEIPEKATLAVRIMARQGFCSTLGQVRAVGLEEYQEIMGEPFTSLN